MKPGPHRGRRPSLPATTAQARKARPSEFSRLGRPDRTLLEGLTMPFPKQREVDILNKLLGEGQLDSQGKFTLDLLHRQEKLVILQRKEPWLFLWKFIQAAQRSQARRLTIEASSEFTRIQFEPGAPCSEDLMAGLLQGDRLESPWLRHLSLGVVLAFASEGRSHRLIYDDGRSRHVLWGDGKREERASQGKLVKLSILGYPVRWWKAWKNPPHLKRLAGDLRRRAGQALIQIVLNDAAVPLSACEEMPGLGLQRAQTSLGEASSSSITWLCESLFLDPLGLAWPSPWGRSNWHNQLEVQCPAKPASLATLWPAPARLLNLSGECPGQAQLMTSALQENQALLVHFQLFDHRLDTATTETRWYLVGLVEGRAYAASRPIAPANAQELKAFLSGLRLSAAVQLAAIPRGPARILPYLDGICLDPLEVPQGPPGALAIVCREDWQVDLSQLQVAHHPQAEQWAAGIWREQVEWVKGFIHSPQQCERMRIPLQVRDEWREYLRLQ